MSAGGYRPWAARGRSFEIVISFQFEAAEGGARVTIDESGYDRVPGDVGLALAAQAAEDYAASLESLMAHLEGVLA